MYKSGKGRILLNYLVISIMVFMIAVLGIFIYTSIHMKDKIIFHVVQQTELISELITRSTLDILSGGHHGKSYHMITAYGNLVGVDDIGIFRLDGREALVGKRDPGGDAPRTIDLNELASFRKAVSTTGNTGFFDQEKMSYSQFVPLKAEGACLSCHKKENRVLGVLKIRLSAEGDFQLLNYVKKLVWAFGFIVFLPAMGLLIAGAIIREKSRTYGQLQESNENLSKTYDELHDTKHYLQMILDNSRVIIVTTDTDGRIVEFNKEAENLLEYSKKDVAGKSVRMLYETPAQMEDPADGAGPRGDDVWAVRDRDVILRSKSGKAYHISLTLSSMLNDRGKPIGTVGVGKDVTEEKMLQFKLLQSEKLAGIGTLASGIAHEINNPLAGVLGMAEAILDEDDLAVIKSYTEDIIKYAVNAGNIVKELSSYSRASHNAGTSTVNLAAVIEDSLKMARHSESFQSIDLETDLDKDCAIIANSGELQQVFVNLIVNAIHAMGDRGKLSVKCHPEGTFVRAEVADTGGGIAEENLNLIFDPFFTTKPPGKGTGLGLYVVYKIVTKHKGSIEVKSRAGQGAAFVLKFPSASAQG